MWKDLNRKLFKNFLNNLAYMVYNPLIDMTYKSNKLHGYFPKNTEKNDF